MQYHQPPPHRPFCLPGLRPATYFTPVVHISAVLPCGAPLRGSPTPQKACHIMHVSLCEPVVPPFPLPLLSASSRGLHVAFMAAIFRTRVNVCPRFHHPPRPEQSVFVPWAHHIKSQKSPRKGTRRRLVVPSHACPPHKESSYVPSPLTPARFPGLNPTRAHHHHLLCGEGENHERLRFRLLA